MPPLPKTASRRPSTGNREREPSSESSSAPRSSSRSRTTRTETLQHKVDRLYVMIGTLLEPFGRFYPALGGIGSQCKSLSTEASEAWMELAAEDKRVLEMLQTLTGASTWGNVIGIHFAIFASAIPGGAYFQQLQPEPQPQNDPQTMMREHFYAQGRAMNLSDEEIEEAIAQAMGQTMPARDTTNGGPGDTVRSQRKPEEATVTVAPPPVAPSKSSIVSPEELGVTQAGMDNTFPHDTAPPNGSGAL